MRSFFASTKARSLVIAATIAVVLVVAMTQLSAGDDSPNSYSGTEVGQTVSSDGISVTLEQVSADSGVTEVVVSYASTDGSVIELLGEPTITLPDGSEISYSNSTPLDQSSNGTSRQMKYEFPADAELSGAVLDLGSTVQYGHDASQIRVALPENRPETGPEPVEVDIDANVEIGGAAHSVTTMTLNDDRFGGSDGGRFFSIDLEPADAAALRQVFAGGASAVSMRDDAGNDYTIVGVSTTFIANAESQGVEEHRLVIVGHPEPSATELTIDFSHFGAIVGPWEYELATR